MKSILMHLTMIVAWPFVAILIMFFTAASLTLVWVFIFLGWYTVEDKKIKFGRRSQ